MKRLMVVLILLVVVSSWTWDAHAQACGLKKSKRSGKIAKLSSQTMGQTGTTTPSVPAG